MSALPQPRGPVSEALLAGLRQRPHPLDPVAGDVGAEDLHLALYCCYELHYRGFDGVDDDWEWEPSLLALRGAARAALRGRAARAGRAAGRAARPARRSTSLLRELMQCRRRAVGVDLHRARGDAPSSCWSSWSTARRTSSRRPTRTRGRCRGCGAAPKAAMVEIQADEYGDGRAGRDPRRAVRARDGGGRAGLHLRRVPGPDPRRDAGDREPDVAASACTGACAARSSGTSRCSR